MWLVLKRTVASGSEESRLFTLLCLDVLDRDHDHDHVHVHVPGLTSGVVVERHHRCRFGLATAGRGVEMSWQRSAVKGRILSYRYHCRLASSPFGWTTGGIVTSSDIFLRARDCCRNGPSTNSWRRTVVDPSAKWKW